MSPGDLANAGEIVVGGEDHSAVHHRRLHNQTGGRSTARLECDQASLERVGIVIGDRDGQGDGLWWDPRTVGDTGTVRLIAGGLLRGQ